MLLCNIAAEVLASFIDANTRIKGDHETTLLIKVRPKNKAIMNGGFIFQFQDGMHSKILPSLLEMYFRHSVRWKSAFSNEIGVNDAFFNFLEDSSKRLV